MTARYALLGDPVEHSPSPAIYAAAFRALGIDARYVAESVTVTRLASRMREFAAGGGGNVTLPHKSRAAALLDRPTSAVRRTGACNCFWGEADGSLVGDNTDVGGFLSAAGTLAEKAGIRLEGSRSLVLGAGGAARAVLIGLDDLGASAADLLNRRPDRAAQMMNSVGCRVLRMRLLRHAGAAVGPYDLVINATSLGLRVGDALPLALGRIEVGAIFDCVYGFGGTPWTRHAETQGLPAMDGLEMLVRQAGLSVQNWLGIEPPPEEMRRAGAAALAGSE